MAVDAKVALPVIIIDEPIGIAAEGAPAAATVDVVIVDIIDEATEALSVYIAATVADVLARDDSVVPLCCMAIASNIACVLLVVGLMLKTIPLPQ